MKNLKLILQVFAIAFVVVIASSCRDEFTEQQAIELESQGNADAAALQAQIDADFEKLQDSLAKAGGIIHYTVSVVDAGNAVFNDGDSRVKGVKAVSGAAVSVAQNGAVTTVTTGADGLAVFNDMRTGNVAVNVAVTDFTDVNFVADLTPKDAATGTNADHNNGDVTRNAATQIPVFPTAGANTTTISGRVTFESDFTNDTPEFPTTNVVAVIRADDAFIGTFIYPDGDGAANEEQAGRVIRISYADAAVSGAVDATTGDYTLTVPASAAGLDYDIGTSDVIADQTFLEETMAADMQYVTGPQVHRAIYGEDLSGQDIPDASAAWVTFSAPAGAVGDAFGSGATATAVVGMSGTIESINVNEAGKMHTQAPDVVLTGDGINGAATAVLGAEGAVTGVTVDVAGQGYSSATAALVFGGTQAVVDPTLLGSIITTVPATGDPVVFSMVDGPNTLGLGNDFATLPAPTFVNTDAGTGTGATAIAYGSVTANSIISAPGSGYVAKYYIDDGVATLPNRRISGPELVISAPDFPDPLDAVHYAQADGFVSLEGPITAIALGDEGTNNEVVAGVERKYVMDDKTAPTLPTISITPAKGASATVTMSTTDGQMDYAWVDNGGTAFTFVPTVAMNNGTGVTQSAILQVGSMGVNAVSVTNAGTSYQRPQNGAGLVSILGGGGAGAAGTITLGTSASGVYWIGAALPQAGYTASTNATWTFDGGGPNPADQIVVTGTVDAGGNLVSLAVTQAGAGFTGVVDPNFVSATNNIPGDDADVQPTFSVASVTVTVAGANYTSSPTATFPTPSGGDPLKVTASGAVTLEVQTIDIITKGAGYNYSDVANTITISGGGGTGATAIPFFATSIASVTVSAGGNFFTAVDDFDLSISHSAPATSPPTFAGPPIIPNPLTYTSPGGLDDMSEVWVTGAVFALALDDANTGGLGYSGTGLTIAVDATDGGTGATISPLVEDDAAFAWVNAGGAGYVVENNAGQTMEVDIDYNGSAGGIDIFINVTVGAVNIAWQDGLLSLAIANGGAGYLANPWVLVTEDPAGSADKRWEDVTATATAGAITAVTIVEVRNYSTYPTVEVLIWRIQATALVNLTTSGIIAVEVDATGSNYTVAPDVLFIGTTGSGAAATANIVDGKVESITVTAAGSGYIASSTPTVVLQVPNTPYVAQGKVNVNEKGIVSSISLYDLGVAGAVAGFGYVTAPTLTISPSMTGVGAGATAVATINSTGKVNSVIITNGGGGFFAANSPAGSGSGAGWSVWPDPSGGLTVYPSKAVVRDFDLGTGFRQ